MPRTLIEADVQVTDPLLGANPFADPVNPDVANGNSLVHGPRRVLVVRNNHATDYITVQPVVQSTVNEATGKVLDVADPTPIEIPAETTMIIGPYSSRNFRESSAGHIYFNWALEAGTIQNTDVDVGVMDL